MTGVAIGVGIWCAVLLAVMVFLRNADRRDANWRKDILQRESELDSALMASRGATPFGDSTTTGSSPLLEQMLDSRHKSLEALSGRRAGASGSRPE